VAFLFPTFSIVVVTMEKKGLLSKSMLSWFG
jgi:hypothetical protein